MVHYHHSSSLSKETTSYPAVAHNKSSGGGVMEVVSLLDEVNVQCKLHIGSTLAWIKLLKAVLLWAKPGQVRIFSGMQAITKKIFS